MWWCGTLPLVSHSYFGLRRLISQSLRCCHGNYLLPCGLIYKLGVFSISSSSLQSDRSRAAKAAAKADEKLATLLVGHADGAISQIGIQVCEVTCFLSFWKINKVQAIFFCIRMKQSGPRLPFMMRRLLQQLRKRKILLAVMTRKLHYRNTWDL